MDLIRVVACSMFVVACGGGTHRYEFGAPQLALLDVHATQATPVAGQMTLEEGYRLALAQSERVAIAVRGVEDAQIQGDIVRTEYIPAIGMIGTAGFEHPKPSTPEGQVFGSIRFQQPVYRLDYSHARAAATLGEESAEASVTAAREQLMRDVAVSFVDVLRTRKLVEVAHTSVKRTQEQLQHATARVEAGQVLINAELLASVDVKRADRQLAVAERDQALAEADFRRLIGRPPPATLEIAEQPATPPQEQLLVVAAKRPDLEALKLRVLQARADEDAASDRRWWPRLDFVAAVQGAEPYILFAPGEQLDWQVFALVTIPLLQSGREYTDVAQARNRSQVARLTFEEQLKLAGEGVESARIQLETAQHVTELAEQELATATTHYNLVDNQFRLGAVTFLEVTNAQAVLVDAENTFVIAKMDQVGAIFDLQFALGVIDLDHPSRQGS